jgi:hypothetical protein
MGAPFPISAMPDTYPTAEDLETFLSTEAGLTVSEDYDLDALCAAAIEEWEERTEYKPFLSLPDAEAVTVRCDPPGPKQSRSTPATMGGGNSLRLPTPFISISAVRNAVSTADAVGTLLVEDIDYDLLPYSYSGAPATGKGYTRIQFRSNLRGAPRSISVTGIQGYCTELTQRVFDAILELAGAAFCRRIKEQKLGDVIRWKEDDVSEDKSIELIQAFGLTWGKRAAAEIFRHKRMD